jgi:hypothetical protein
MVLAYPERNLSERRVDNLESLHSGRRQAARLNGVVKVPEMQTQNAAPQS